MTSRAGVRRLIAAALEAKADEYVQRFTDAIDEHGHRMVTLIGHCKKRQVQTAVGAVLVHAFVCERPQHTTMMAIVSGSQARFCRRTYGERRVPTCSEELNPWMYLKRIPTDDFEETLDALLGPGAQALSATTIVRLKQVWETECEEWSRRNLSGKWYVYMRIDGIHCNIRLEEHRQYILVFMLATSDSKKELVAVHDGHRESKQSWHEVLLYLKSRGLATAPKIAVGDGALEFWKALPQVWATTKVQRCWVHKARNVLNKMPKKLQPTAKDALHQIWMANMREGGNAVFDLFIVTYEPKYAKPAVWLAKDREDFLVFFYGTEHWMQLRMTNPIESTFATVRLRTRRTKGSESRKACLAIVFELGQADERKWRKHNEYQLFAAIIEGFKSKEGARFAA